MISLVVLVRDRITLTRRCLRSLAAATPPEPLDLIIVDNASRESIIPLADEFRDRFARVTVVRNSFNESFSVACNRATAQAVGSWFIFVNNDVEVETDCLLALWRAHRARPDAGVLGGKLRYPSTGRLQHAGMRQMLWGYASNWGVGGVWDDARVMVTGDVFAVVGALLAVDAKLFRHIGGFDESYRWGYEDVDLCLSATAAGRAVIFVHDACAWHDASTTLGSVRRPADEEGNYVRYRGKWDARLIPREQKTTRSYRGLGIRRVAIFGTGQAARGLHRALVSGGIDVVAFTASHPPVGETVCGQAVVPLDELRGVGIDRLIVGTQAFLEVEEAIRPYDPQGHPIVPTVD